MKEKRKRKTLNAYLLVILSFVLVIVAGSVCLAAPFARLDGKWGNYLDALFTATSATCVTGLCPYADGVLDTLTVYGQVALLVMIQIGGLGFITVLTFIFTLFRSKLQFKNRYFLSQAVNSTNFADVVKFVRKIILISFIAELVGFGLGIPVFYQMYNGAEGGWFHILWGSLFTAVSAFNNAGFDLFGATSLIREGNNLLLSLDTWAYIYLLIYLMVLIVIGGISFMVILDVFASRKKPKQWRAFTKIVLMTTLFLIVAGMIGFVFTDGPLSNNAVKISWLECLFQSVTCRTAGFAASSQSSLSTSGKVISCLLMFIGGSPLSTAGGIKTTTIFTVLLAIGCYVGGKPVTAFKRSYSANMIVKAMSLIFMALFLIIVSYILLCNFERSSLASGALTKDGLIFEAFSAFGTTGLSADTTVYLSSGSKIVIICLMFAGRLGPMTFFQLFQSNMDKKVSIHYDYVEEDILIG